MDAATDHSPVVLLVVGVVAAAGLEATVAADRAEAGIDLVEHQAAEEEGTDGLLRAFLAEKDTAKCLVVVALFELQEPIGSVRVVDLVWGLLVVARDVLGLFELAVAYIQGETDCLVEAVDLVAHKDAVAGNPEDIVTVEVDQPDPAATHIDQRGSTQTAVLPTQTPIQKYSLPDPTNL